ncbi:uncharacterized protein IL334_006861 [Kwoniella shivajii]|uniref:Uncharacterized protein n=1 Tax=Kwoniella shivajii TaxID=564305 RepID=A0ABZ1D7I9_9TREE|nr:hypothetical protein IL334_006861 [Kwoniella shivajii]
MTSITPPPQIRTKGKLPSSSPSSARLRRIAPSPVMIPSTKCNTSPRMIKRGNHVALTALSNSPSSSTSSSSSSSSSSTTQKLTTRGSTQRKRRESVSVSVSVTEHDEESEIEFEFEFVPLELVILSSPDTQIRTLFQMLESSRSASSNTINSTNNKSNMKRKKKKDTSKEESCEIVEIPLIFDSRGEFGTLAYESNLKQIGLNVPPCEDSEDNGIASPISSPTKKRRLGPSTTVSTPHSTNGSSGDLTMKSRRRSGLSLLTPKRYLAQYQPSPILIQFREDIFDCKGREAIWVNSKPDESTPRPTTTKYTTTSIIGDDSYKNQAEDIGRTQRADSSNSFATFGHDPENQREQNLSMRQNDQDLNLDQAQDQYQDDNWSFTLSAYEDSDGKKIIRKDSFFASSSIISNNKDDQSDLSLNTLIPSTKLDISFDLPSIPNDRLTFVPPHLDSSLMTIDFDSPSSETLITPQPPSHRTWPPRLLVVDHEMEATPTPKNPRPVSKIQLAQESTPNMLMPRVAQPQNAETGRIEEGDGVERALKNIDKAMTIQLWIDQEGTREHKSSLKYMRSIKPSVFREREEKALQQAAIWCESPTRPENFQQSGCWEFGMDPKERDKWYFHHAALEGLPVLRRLTINGDDKYDFLSRGATLQIKEPGVYSVCGQEDRGRSEWKFEYLVQHKISLNTGEVVPNERIIVPLGLYVSPNFFNHDRALKTSLLNLFKKSLASNIMSEKVRPPHIGRPPLPLLPSVPTPTAVDDIVPTPTAVPVISSAMKEENVNQGRKRAQTQSQTLSHGQTTQVISHSHARSVSRTFGAIAKAVVGITSTTPTQSHHNHAQNDSHTNQSRPPTPGNNTSSNINRPSSAGIGISIGVHKFGTKPATFGKTGSRARTPTGTNITDPVLGGITPGGESNDYDKKDGKIKGRKRATSLFSKSRPFTPPVNITELHPIPTIGLRSTPTSTPNPSSASVSLPASMPIALNPNGTGNLSIPLQMNNHTSISLPLQQSGTASKQQNTSLNQLHIQRNRLSHQGHYQQPHHQPHHQPHYQPQHQQHHQQHPFLHPMYNSPSPAPSFSSLGLGQASPTPSSMIITPVATPLLSRSSSITSRSRPIIASSGQNLDCREIGLGKMNGLTPAPRNGTRGIRKRPSTAEPRLGMR